MKTCTILTLVILRSPPDALQLDNYIPYSQKYWWELNLAVEPQITISKILADLNLAVR